MKYIIPIFLALFISSFSHAQVSTIKIDEKKEVVVAPYDSLESINEDNYKSHIGQTLYLREENSAKRDGFYSNFYTKPNLRKRYKSDYNFLKGRYFYVDDIYVYNEHNTYPDGYIRLIEKESNDVVYYGLYLSSFKKFITVGYIEKLKSMYVGKEYVRVLTDYVKSWGDGSVRTEIPRNTVLKCVDIAIMEDGFYPFRTPVKSDDALFDFLQNTETPFTAKLHNEDFPYIAIMENDELGKSFVRLRDIQSKYEFKTIEEYEKELANFEIHTNTLIEEYGQENAELILQKKIAIGFTKEMCRESWGAPREIVKTIDASGEKEQWVYDNEYLFFKDDVLTEIQQFR
jgi:hypothetical protein